MKPGSELDALVAEKVMGLGKVGAWGRPYSTSIAAAWEVVEEAFKRGWYIEPFNPVYECVCVWIWLGVGFGEDQFQLAASAMTAPHAICLAALKAVGVVVPECQ